jgi:hypothetical protein
VVTPRGALVLVFFLNAPSPHVLSPQAWYLGPVCLGCGWLAVAVAVAVKGKLLWRESCLSECHCLATWLAV